ncbi:MAG TPA: 23S rRNA (guanosine(2251)-2'-O)-methyltransferase RlmB [Chitinophagaceae bacterium]|nr:23S rRNA (guanosine(2251)-2'-O)-methyltransferase RlmB [Chitinophagaceae bacterium]
MKTSFKNTFIIGRQPVLEALHAGKQIDRIFIQKNTGGDIIYEIRKLANDADVPVNVVPIEKLNSFTRANHQGIVAIAGLISYTDLQAVIDHVVSSGEVPLFVMLDGITDVRNIGAIARSALCCGAQAIIIPDKGVGAINEEAMKSSAGALNNIHVCRVNSLIKAVDTMHLNGIKVCSAEMKADKKLDGINWQEPCCVIMGSEDKGIQPFLTKAADEKFTIPMSGKFESFNVSVAAGIILYAALRQRGFE